MVEAYNYISQNNNLTQQQKQILSNNLTGVDIDPGMAKIARVNLYLHGFKTPKITEDDTLTNLALWGTKYDVILANPPFMTPKGGIKPHDKFVKANKAEVLFTDYISEYLKLEGRAGIVVPEGIIFQSATAYKALRKKLVDDDYLLAVISLPSGVFQPYSGVKTSILILDRKRAKTSDSVLFIKITNDGFDLSAQRRENTKNDLPEALKLIGEFSQWNDKHSATVEEPLRFQDNDNVQIVSKSKLRESGDYNLSGDRYKATTDYTNSKYPIVELGKVCEVYQPKTITSNEITAIGEYKVFGANGVIGYYEKFNHENPEIAITCRGATCGNVNLTESKSWITGNAMVVSPKGNNLDKIFLYNLLKNTNLNSVISGSAQPQITGVAIKPFKIPLPPLEIQQKIVEEISGYQKNHRRSQTNHTELETQD